MVCVFGIDWQRDGTAIDLYCMRGCLTFTVLALQAARYS